MSPVSKSESRYGAGSVEALPSGRFRVRVRMPDGSRVGELCATREEAEALRVAIVAGRYEAAKRGEYEPPPVEVQETPTLASWGRRWLERRKTRVRWFANDKTRWGLYVVETELAKVPLAELRPKHIRTWLADLCMLRRGGKLLSTRTVSHTLNLVRVALSEAVEEELLPTNPAVGIKIPKRSGVTENATRAHLTAEEIRVVEAGVGIPEDARLLYVVAIYTGLRQGELWGLRWGDVHEGAVRPEVIVRWSHQHAPKNGKVQPVPLLPKARAAFERLRLLATVGGVGPAVDDLVFPTRRGKPRQHSDDAGWSSRKVRGRARVGHREVLGVNREVHFHGLRHTCASHLLTGTFGVTLALAEVRVFLRHEDVSTTDRYAHLAPGHLLDRIAALPSVKPVAAAAPSPSTEPLPPEPSAATPPLTPAVDPKTASPDASPSAEEIVAGSRGPAFEVQSSVGHMAHVGHLNLAHADPTVVTKPLFSGRAILDSNQWPWASETHALSS